MRPDPDSRRPRPAPADAAKAAFSAARTQRKPAFATSGLDRNARPQRAGWRRHDRGTRAHRDLAAPRPAHPRLAKEVEALGYGAIWVGGSPPADLSSLEELLEATSRIAVATGIVNIWATPADRGRGVLPPDRRAHPGRFLLGVGIGHPEASGVPHPYRTLVDYLDVLDAKGVPVEDRVLAALGPRSSRSPRSEPRARTPT